MSSPEVTFRERADAQPQLWRIRGDGVLEVNFHEGQARVWNSDRRFVIMCAGSQSGKTSFGPIWLWREMQRCGPGDYICATPSFPLLEKKMLPSFREWFEDILALGDWMEGRKEFVFNDFGTKTLFGEGATKRTRVMFGSATNASSLESATALAAWLDELGQPEFGEDSWDAIRRRVSLYRGRILGTTTPYSSTGWFVRRLYEPWKRGSKDIDFIQFESTANPNFTQEEFDSIRREMQSWKFDLFFRGQLSKPAALIYNDYLPVPREEGGHLVEPLHPPWTWGVTLGIDFGAVNTAVVWIAEDPHSGDLYVFKAAMLGRKSTVDYAAAVRSESKNLNVIGAYGGAPGESQQRADWADAKFDVMKPVVSDVESGIDRVVSLLLTKRIFFCSDLPEDFFTELTTYSRKVDDSGVPVEEIHNKNAFHYMDALRYGVIGALNPTSLVPAEEELAQYFGFAQRGWRG